MLFDRRQLCVGMAALASTARLQAAVSSRGQATLLALASETEREYHDPALAKRVADRLRALGGSGGIAALSDEQLAERINGIIAEVSHDGHFMVMPGVMGEMRNVPPTEPHQSPPPLTPAEQAYLRKRNFGVAAAEVLPGNIGRLEIYEQFYRPALEVRQAVGAAMTKVAKTDGLIVDLSRTIGGDPLGVANLASYFFDREPFVVNRFRWRNLPVQEFWTSNRLEGPNYGEKRPVAVLVSGSSFSAAEEFAYDMQVLKRGIIVGERTPGAANHALPVTLPGGFTAFIPKARAENPITRTNWEGKGITPDIRAKPPTIEAARLVLAERIASARTRPA